MRNNFENDSDDFGDFEDVAGEDKFDDLGEFDLADSLEQSFEEPEPSEDENSLRYGFMFLKDLPLYKHVGNEVLIDANIRDKYGSVIHNRDYYPKNTLILFRQVSAPTPAEGVATEVASNGYESHSRPFNPGSAESGAMVRRITKNPLQCAKYFTTAYGKMGGTVLNSLTGIDSYAKAKELLMVVLPLDDAKIFPPTAKNILGEEFKAPFLYQILTYLQSTAPRERIQNAEADSDVKLILKTLLNELLAGARMANGIAKGHVNDTEGQIAATPQQKSGYDIRDTTFKNAQEPFDLLCLAHLNRLPMDERALENARRLQENSGEPIKEMTQSVQKLAELMAAQQIEKVSPMHGMTNADIQKMVKSQVQEGIKQALRAGKLDAAKPEGEQENSDERAEDTDAKKATAK